MDPLDELVRKCKEMDMDDQARLFGDLSLAHEAGKELQNSRLWKVVAVDLLSDLYFNRHTADYEKILPLLKEVVK
ncbi:MAG: hypothetical protein ABSG01_10030 [Anaerolineales bacterium]|jgi:hypothetical protein